MPFDKHSYLDSKPYKELLKLATKKINEILPRTWTYTEYVEQMCGLYHIYERAERAVPDEPTKTVAGLVASAVFNMRRDYEKGYREKLVHLKDEVNYLLAGNIDTEGLGKLINELIEHGFRVPFPDD